MRLLERKDTSLAIALIAGALIVFNQPLRGLLDFASDVERQYHLDLVQALLVLTVVFVFHQYRKRQEAKAEAVASAAEARRAQQRSEELERLVALGRGLAKAFDFAGLSQALWRYLPKFTRDRAMWLLTRRDGRWDILIQDADEAQMIDALESRAVRTLAADAGGGSHAEGILVDDVVCFPLMIGTNAVGMVQVCNTPPLSIDDRQAIGAAAALAAIAVRNVQAFLETRENSLRDGLTGCFNRSHGLEILDTELRRVRRTGQPLSLVMFDIDRFKMVNDQHGHMAGDALLAEVGRTLTRVLRTSDIKCRYGGDEFLVVLPETPSAGAEQVAECLLREIASLTPAWAPSPGAVTASIGTATATQDDVDAPALIARADRALYRAKQSGRNRACQADTRPIASLRVVNFEPGA